MYSIGKRSWCHPRNFFKYLVRSDIFYHLFMSFLFGKGPGNDPENTLELFVRFRLFSIIYRRFFQLLSNERVLPPHHHHHYLHHPLATPLPILVFGTIRLDCAHCYIYIFRPSGRLVRRTRPTAVDETQPAEESSTQNNHDARKMHFDSGGNFVVLRLGINFD